MQGVGFTDEISEQVAMRIASNAREALAEVAAFELTFRDAIVADEAVVLPAEPGEPVLSLRNRVRAAVGDILGQDRLEPRDASRYRPHVSIAYISDDGPATPYIDAVQSIRPAAARARINHVDLIAMHRDRRMYEWTVVATLPLG